MMRVNTAWHVHRRERGGARVELEQTDVHLLRSSTERSVVFRTMSELRDQEDGRATDGTRGKAGTKRRPTEICSLVGAIATVSVHFRERR